MNIKLACIVAGATLALAACGGGGGSDEALALDDGAVPDSALSSPEAFSRWVGQRPADDSSDPLAMNPMAAPSSDTAEPIEVD